jgi:hypothetical protein
VRVRPARAGRAARPARAPRACASTAHPSARLPKARWVVVATAGWWLPHWLCECACAAAAAANDACARAAKGGARLPQQRSAHRMQQGVPHAAADTHATHHTCTQASCASPPALSSQETPLKHSGTGEAWQRHQGAACAVCIASRCTMHPPPRLHSRPQRHLPHCARACACVCACHRPAHTQRAHARTHTGAA